MKTEKTLILIKPDGVERGLVGEIIRRFEMKGFSICALKFLKMDEELAAKHYAEHVNKDFYEGLVKFMISAPIIAMVIEGVSAVSYTRKICGATNPANATPGTIRSDYTCDTRHNLVHASDSAESAIREINIFFDKDEIIEHKPTLENYIF